MLRSLSLLTRMVCLLAALLGASGCSSDRIAGWLVARKLDEYLDLDRAQEKRLRPRVDEGLTAVRRDTLPAWIGLLREARDRMATPATDAQLSHLQDRYDQTLDGAVGQIIPRISPVLADLSDAQVDHFIGKLRKLNDKNFEEQLVKEDQRQKTLDDHVIDGIEELIGDVNDGQRARILATFHAFPDDRAAQYKLNRRELDDFQKFLKANHDAQAVAANLQRMWDVRYTELGPERDRATRLAEQRKLMLTISDVMTPRQRARGVETMNEHIATANKFQLPEPGAR